MDQKLVVVDPRFCVPYEIQLRLKERASWSGDDFEITQLPTNQPWFVIKGKAFSLRDEKVMHDVHGRAVATMRHPFSFRSKMEVTGPGYSFMVIEKFKFFGHEAKAVIQDMLTKQQHTIYLHGNWLEYNAKLYLGKKAEGGRLLAYASRRVTMAEIFADRQTYDLNIMPGVDVALCVLLCIAFDEFWNEDN